jgi:hypothetical protein
MEWQKIEFIWLRTGQMAGFSEQGNKSSISIKCGKYLD